MGRGKRRAAASAAAAVPQALVERQKPFVFFPSDLTWLFSECPHCFYLKVRMSVKRPGGAMPAIFRHIDTQIRDYCLQLKRTEEVCPQMPPGEFISGEKWVRSASFSMPGHSRRFTLGGKPDALVRWDAGGYGVIDFKTTAVKESSGGFYAKQLEMYSRAIESPAKEKERENDELAEPLTPVTLNGLLAWQPELFADGDLAVDDGPRGLNLKGKLIWIPVERQVDGLRQILDGVMTMLEADEAPPPSQSCGFCRYRGDISKMQASARLANEANEAKDGEKEGEKVGEPPTAEPAAS